ncbi:flavodoxin family protein [Ferrimonas lipolytica]|uniref:Flavodoxin family protein n=2 Tax=Ferrimonas lipolytica TaxID=2724191 RepID=A0A6H1UJ26_9GAMM|nr:NAD(P)H-dependent oxidoreductase [Ferrimonas lipolytica]QIZ78828.1 flavodoxin family protein [Ferrimonas lipolytica]
MTTPNNVLLLMAHPNLRHSEINLPLFQQAQKIPGVTAIDLYAHYPRFNIDIEAEQQRLQQHDTILFQFPLYWYSVPSLLKEWMDLVFEYGFAYGSEGTALHGKRFGCVISAGGKKDAYCDKGINHFSIEELLRPLEQTASLTGMIYQQPLTLFGARTAAEDGSLERHLENCQQHLQLFIKEPAK